jgi:hypothetical protein
MEFARKMILVPQECLEQRRDDSSGGVTTTTLTPHSVQTPGTTTTRLDEEMSKILNSTDDIRQKSLQYQQVLQRFLHHKEEERENGMIHQTNEPSVPSSVSLGSNDNDEDESDKRILESVPPKFRSNAKQLIRYLRDAGNIKWNNRGVITLDGVVVKGANIVDLVNEAMRGRKRPTPPGYEQFARILRQVSVPREFIGNNQLWDTIRSLDSTATSEGDNSFATVDDDDEEEEDQEQEIESRRGGNIADATYVDNLTDGKKRKRGEKRVKLNSGGESIASSQSQTPSIPLKKSRIEEEQRQRVLRWEHMDIE